MEAVYSDFSPPTPTIQLEQQTPATESMKLPEASVTTTSETVPTVTEQGGVATSGVATLDQELANVMSGLGSFWGKVSKASVNVYQTSTKQIDQLATTARADLTPLLAKTKANLDSFGETAKAELHRLSEASKLDVNDSSNDGMFVGADGNVIFIDTVIKDTTKKDTKGKGVDRSEHEGDSTSTNDSGIEGSGNESTPAAQATAFFSKLQTQLSSNPNFKELSKNLTTLQHSVSDNLSNLPTSLTTNLNHLQTQLNSLDLHESTRVAEEYILKGEGWIADLGLEVQRLAKEAVTVIPASEIDNRNQRKVERMKEAEQVAVGRKEGLLMRLRNEANIILLVDPAQPPSIPSAPTTTSADSETTTATSPATNTMVNDTRESYSKFLQSIEQSGGIEGINFNTQIANELHLTISNAGENLKRALLELVPGKMSSETFWCRYFFRVSQIEEDEIRRRRVLEVAAGEEEDFSWDAEEEEEESSTIAKPSTPLVLPSVLTSPTEEKDDSVSRRESSEATTSSYDLVGIKSGEGSEVGDVVGDVGAKVEETEVVEKKEEKPKVVVVEKKEEEDDGEDSDWE